MKGFTFYPLNNQSYDSHQQECEHQDALFRSGLRKEIQSSGAGLSRILQHRKKADLIFITAYRTGTDADRGGYKFYKEGEKDSLGNVHKEGDSISNKENQRQNKNLAWWIQKLGYGFVKVEGHYASNVEVSYCVVNLLEDTQDFIANLSQLANKFSQDSILVVPKDEQPYFLYANGGKDLLKDDPKIIADAVADYTTIKNKKFTFVIDSSSGCRDSLVPHRGGFEHAIPVQIRQQFFDERAADHLVKMMR